MHKWLLITLLGVSTTLHAQAEFETDPKTGKKGLFDAGTYERILPLVYDDVQSLRSIDSLIKVKVGALWGLYTKKGRLIVPVRYDHIDLPKRALFKSYVSVEKNGLLGLYHCNGKEVLPPKFGDVQAIRPDVVMGRLPGDSLLQFYDDKGAFLFKAAGEVALEGYDANTVEIMRVDQSRYFLDKTGKAVFPDHFVNARWTDGRSVICAYIAPGEITTSNAGLYKSDGTIVLPPFYARIKPAGENRFFVRTTDNQMALVDENGTFLIPMAPIQLSNVNDVPGSAVYCVEKGKPNGHIYDLNGNRLVSNCRTSIPVLSLTDKVPDQYPERYFTAFTDWQSATYGLFRTDGSQILPMQYRRIGYTSERHPLIVTTDSLFKPYSPFFIALAWDGRAACPGRFQELECTVNPKILYGKPENHSRSGFIHLDNPSEAQFIYERISPLSPLGYYAVQEGAYYYLHDQEGKRLHSEGFSYMRPPHGIQYEQWRAKGIKTRLAAVGWRTQETAGKPWVGLDENGKAYDFAPPISKPRETGMAENVPTGKPADLPLSKPATPPAAEKIYAREETDPPAEFPGGDSALADFLAKNLKYPVLARDSGIKGRVSVSFIVEKDGSLKDPKIVSDIGGGCGKEALRLVGLMPKWVPGQFQGRAVRTKYTLPVLFKN